MLVALSRREKDKERENETESISDWKSRGREMTDGVTAEWTRCARSVQIAITLLMTHHILYFDDSANTIPGV